MSLLTVAIPGVIAEFLESRGSVGVAATRDRRLKPRVHYLSGWSMADRKGGELTCLVAHGFTEGLLASLEENGEFAATIEHIGSHETYQFKGTYEGSRPPDAGDRATWERLRTRFSAGVQRVDPQLGLPDAWLREYIPPPEIAIRMQVREIFMQTPGPGAGKRLVPPEER